MMKILQQGSTGQFVVQWQIFLRGQGYLLNSSGTFDEATVTATRQFQKKYQLQIDGIVGNQTLGKAALLGFELVDFSETDDGFPPKPNFPPLVNNAARQNLFGPLQFVPAATPKNPEGIKIVNGWDTSQYRKDNNSTTLWG